ncbi:hypothetical protein DVH24_020949 [Malus domestica]|uniref:DUF1985 domain-containing protein n=1 Tax=Malus domestica TaxID=3750 RepID=A0A498J9V5_MALDO|nr:hypothetical protein DVH24_020949 [Malus domestica]
MVNYATGLMKLVDVEVIEKFSEMMCQAEVTRFTKNDFCLIKGLRCDEPYDLEVKPSNIRLLIKYFPQKFGFVGESRQGKGRDKGKGKVVKRKGRVKTAFKKAIKKLETVFKQCEDEDAALKMRLVYFADSVLIRAKNTVSMNLEYLDLVQEMDRFNTYSWGVILFE